MGWEGVQWTHRPLWHEENRTRYPISAAANAHAIVAGSRPADRTWRQCASCGQGGDSNNDAQVRYQDIPMLVFGLSTDRLASKDPIGSKLRITAIQTLNCAGRNESRSHAERTRVIPTGFGS